MIDYRDHINVDADISLTGQVKSTLSGLAPFLVASSLLVSNLNADLLDGYHASDFIANNNDAYKYRGGYNTVDANTLLLPGWYDNGAGSATGDNYPVNSSGFISVTPFRASSFSGFVQEYSTAGTVLNLNKNRRYWRTSWNGVFSEWQEYASVSRVENMLTGYATTSALSSGLSSKENSFSKGNLVQGSGVSLSGTLSGRLVGSGDVTIAANLSGYATETWVTASYVPQTRTISINGATHDLSTNRSWTITTDMTNIYTKTEVNNGFIANNNDAYKYRGGYNTVDANTLLLPGWYDNGAGSPSGDNYPVNSSGFIAVTPFRASSFSGFVQEYSTAGTVSNLNKNRRYWRTSWNGVFSEWQEYASVSAVETLLTGYAVKATTLAGYGIANAYTKAESDGRYIQGAAGNFLQASGFASSDYNLNTANSVRAHGGSSSYANAPSISASTDTYRTVVTFDGHSVNANAGKYKGQIAFNSVFQFSFRQEVNTVWSNWINLVTETQIANFITASSSNTLTNKSGNISMWTNNTGYITGINSGMITTALGFTPASNAIGINTTNSLTGGGALNTSRTLSLVNDNGSPGNNKYYGTNASGTKGFHDLPSGGGSGTVTQVGLLVPTGFTVTSTPVTTNGNLQFAFASGYSLPTTASQNAWNAKIGGSGSTNRIPMFTAGSTLGDSPIYHNGGNIGIGTSPSHKFQVAGNTYIGGDLFTTGTISTSSNCAASTGFSTASGGYYAGTGSMSSSALLQIDSTSKGVAIPRMTMTQFNAISGKVPGLMAMIVDPVNSSNILGLMFYTGSTTKYFQVI